MGGVQRVGQDLNLNAPARNIARLATLGVQVPSRDGKQSPDGRAFRPPRRPTVAVDFHRFSGRLWFDGVQARREAMPARYREELRLRTTSLMWEDGRSVT